MLLSLMYVVPILLAVSLQVALFCGPSRIAGEGFIGFQPSKGATAAAMGPPVTVATGLLLMDIIDASSTRDAGTLFGSITQRLLVLPGDTLLFPGYETHHRSVSTIAEERDFNPCIAGRSRDEFITQRCMR